MHRVFLRLALLLLAAAPAWGWGNEGHTMVNDGAAAGLGPEAPDYLRESRVRLAYLGPEPDRWRIRDLDCLNRGAAPDHFIDLEWAKGVDPKDPPPNRHEYGRLVARNLKKSPDNVGYAPYRALELCQRIEAHVASLALVRGEGTEAEEQRRQARENIIFTAGVLGHYVADLSNPHHTTIHYNGWTGENPEGFPTDKSTHFRFESAFVGRIQDQLKVEVSAPVNADIDYEQSIWELVVESNSLVKDLYRLDKGKAFATGNEESELGLKGKAFAQARLIRSATLLRDLWTTACVRGERRGRSESLRLRIKEAFDEAGLDLRVAVRLDGFVKVWGELQAEGEGTRAREIVGGFEGVSGTEFRLKKLY